MQATVRLELLLARARGIVAVIGSGGKSTLLERGGAALAAAGRSVVLATSTHMLPPSGVKLVSDLPLLDAELGRSNIAAIGVLDAESGKLTAPTCGIAELERHAHVVLVEADGSKRLPLKAHEPWEPVVPPSATQTVLVVGASGFGQPIAQAVHRPEVFCRLTGAQMGETATPELVARAIAAEGLVGAGDLVIVNQVDAGDGRRLEDARAFARKLCGSIPAEVWAGSLREDRLYRA